MKLGRTFEIMELTWRHLFNIKSFIQMTYVHIIKVHYL